MFWTRGILGTDLYHIVQWFLIYSMLGWLVESIYMSVCNRKLTNRGFMRGPMCPIYGDRKSTRLNSSHITRSRMPSSA